MWKYFSIFNERSSPRGPSGRSSCASYGVCIGYALAACAQTFRGFYRVESVRGRLRSSNTYSRRDSLALHPLQTIAKAPRWISIDRFFKPASRSERPFPDQWFLWSFCCEIILLTISWSYESSMLHCDEIFWNACSYMSCSNPRGFVKTNSRESHT